jgi:SulP family sulfate permease
MTALTQSLARIAQATHQHRLLPVLTTGLMIGLLSTVQAVSYSALIFSGDLSAFVGPGIGLALLATLLNLTFIAVLASLPGSISGIQDVPTVIMAVAATAIAQQLSGSAPPQDIFVTVVVAIGITTLATGACLYALGHFRLGGLVRFLPYSVIGGVLAGTGWLLITGAITTMTEQSLGLSLLQADMLLRWVPGVLFAIALLWAYERSAHALLVPGIVLAGTALFYAVMFGAGKSMAEVSVQGWLSGPFSEGGLWRQWSWNDLARVHWRNIASQAATMATIPVLSAVALLLNATALEITMQRDADLDRELKAAGIANLFAGAAGGLTGYQQLGKSMMTYRVGAASRLTGLVAALVCGLALFQGASLMSLFPRVVLGGLLLFLGLSFLVEWVWKAWFRLPKADYAVVILILLSTALLGFLEAIGVGLAAAMILFIVHYSKVDVVRQTVSGAVLRSRVMRSPSQRETLRLKGDATCVLQLQGYLFFGTAGRLLAQVRDRLDDPALPTLRYVLLDFHRVTGVDTTISLTFNKLRQLMQPRQLTLVVTDASAAVTAQLASAGLREGEGYRLLGNLDRGLEWCESQLLDEVSTSQTGLSAEPPVCDVLAELLPNLASVDRLLDYLQREVLARGQWLMRRGEAPEHLYLLVCGQLTAQRDHPAGAGREPMRLQTQRGAQVIGEIGFYLGQPRSADVIADVPSVVYRLSADDLRRMEQQDPALASELHQLIVRLLAGRVMHLTEAMDALQR